jgi:hypothetical protein
MSSEMAFSAVCPVALIKKTKMKLKTDLISTPFCVISYTNLLTLIQPESKQIIVPDLAIGK